MTKEEWEQVKKTLESLFHMANLKIDGYDVSLCLQRTSTYKNSIVVYVNGVLKGEWLGKDCEERRRFLQKREHSVLSAKEKAKLKKFSKKFQKEFDRKYSVYYPYWTSFGSLKKHLIENNERIELVSTK